MLKKPALAFMLATTSALGLSGCAQEIDTVQSETGTVHPISTFEAIPATSFVAFGYENDAHISVDNVADCFQVASWMLLKNPETLSNAGVCRNKDGDVIVGIKRKEDGAVYMTRFFPPKPK